MFHSLSPPFLLHLLASFSNSMFTSTPPSFLLYLHISFSLFSFPSLSPPPPFLLFLLVSSPVWRLNWEQQWNQFPAGIPPTGSSLGWDDLETEVLIVGSTGSTGSTTEWVLCVCVCIPCGAVRGRPCSSHQPTGWMYGLLLSHLIINTTVNTSAQ